MNNETVTVAEILAEANRLVEYLENLGYDQVFLSSANIEGPKGREGIRFGIYCTDDFQHDVAYEARKQHGTVYINYLSGDETKLLNREQRELHVLLAQQGESVAISGMLVSAAGKRFTDVIHAERAKYAQLVDWR